VLLTVDVMLLKGMKRGKEPIIWKCGDGSVRLVRGVRNFEGTGLRNKERERIPLTVEDACPPSRL
jgi:hypothetical protein